MISSFYRDKLTSLNVDRSSGHPKPHKVCLLLAVIDLIENGDVSKNVFVIDDQLKSRFGYHFDRLKKGNDAEKIIQPFYHLHTDNIWHFKIKPGMQSEYQALVNAGNTPSIKALFNVIDYAYLDDELYAYFRNDLTRNTARQLLLENLDDLSVQFQRWLLSMGKSERTANSYVGAIKGAISNWADEADICHRNLISIQSFSRISHIAQELALYDVFLSRNAKGNQMYSAALNSYRDFLSIASQSQVSDDIEKIISDDCTDPTQKAMLVNTRIGQGKFREKLIDYWKGCAVTGYPAVQFLVASHIKPWRFADDVERLDPYNGILLLPNLDKAFDLGYVTFSEKGKILTSEFIESPGVLGIDVSMKINVVNQHQDYLAYHRSEIFERNC